MFKKIMKRLINNLGLKVLSVLFAVILWMIVVNYDDPEISKTFTVPVNVVQTQTLEERGQVYDIIGESNIATIYVSGKRSYLDKLNASDFQAIADLSQIQDLHKEGNEKLVPINVSARRYDKYLTITQKNHNMRINIEDLKTIQLYVEGIAAGTPAERYAVGDIRVSPNLLKLSGPESVISKIARAEAAVSVEGLAENVSMNVTPVVYDKDGKMIETARLTLSQNTVNVKIPILGTKTVPIRCENSGTPADGFYFMGLEYAPETVAIKAAPAVLKDIFELVIPGEAISIAGASADVETTIDMTEYLGEGVSLVEAEENEIAVKAIIGRMEATALELPVTSIAVKNLPEDYLISYEDEKIPVLVRTKPEDREELHVDLLTAVIDLGNLEPGIHTVQVQLTIPEKYHLLGTASVQVNITEKVDEPGILPGEDGSMSGEDNIPDTPENGTGEDGSEGNTDERTIATNDAVQTMSVQTEDAQTGQDSGN